VLLSLRYGSLLRLTLRLSYWFIGVTGIVELATRYFYGGKSGLVSQYQPSRFITVSQSSIEKYTSRAIRYLSEGLSDVRKVFDAEDLSLSLVAFVSVYISYYLTAFLSFSTLLFIAVISAFTIPPLYLQFQTEIDDVVAYVSKEACNGYKEVHKQVKSAAGPHLDAAKTQLENAAAAVGYKRGGFPATPADKKAAPVADPSEIPGPAAETAPSGVTSATPTKAPKLSDNGKVNSVDPDSHTPKYPKVSDAAADDVASYTSVPTLIGNVSLDPHASSKPIIPDEVSSAFDHVDPTADIKKSIAQDKQTPILN